MAGGRPRFVSLPPNQMEDLGKEMLAWIKLNKPIHLCQWYTIEKGFTYNEWKSFIQIPEFLPYYEQALKVVGMKYLDGTVDKSIAQRFLRVYFKDLKEEENDQLEFESKLRSREASTVSEDAIVRHEAMMSQIRSLQTDRKSASKTIKEAQ